MQPPDRTAINLEIETLRGLMPQVKRFSSFNDDHHAAIEQQIAVLEAGGLSVEALESLEPEDWRLHDTHRWLMGETPEPPHQDWLTLVKQ